MSDKVPITILYVEDEHDLRERIRIVLEMQFERVYTCAHGKEALELFSREHPDIIVSDIMMPVMDGLEMTKSIRDISPDTPIILTTAFTDTAYLLKAIELGVSAYVRKPVDCRQLLVTITKAATPILQKNQLEKERQRGQASMGFLLGNSPAMHDVVRQAQLVAETDFSLIIQGESGVGKSHLASLIHGLSPRKHGPFVAVTIGALPGTLVESQLFGHVKGAFTGATVTQKGLFEEAHSGTLFLDDVDCTPPAVQAKILHAVEHKQFYPVGGTKKIAVDTRIIAASNRNLYLEVQKGNFREDLYYRLGDMVISLPPLRERGDDIKVLARTFLQGISQELNRVPPRITPEAIMLLHRHPWPGNVRELKSVMKRAALFAGDVLTGEKLTAVMAGFTQDRTETGVDRLQTLEDYKRLAVKQALAATDGKKMDAARLLDVDYSSFKRMLDRYKL